MEEEQLNIKIPNTNINDIKNLIEELGREFSQKQGLILSEDDLKCHLFNKLYNQYYDGNYQTLDNGILGCPIHSEIRFYNGENKLAYIPDITILNPDSLSIKKRLIGHGLPSKQFEFGGDAVIFELKFCKNETGVSKKDIALYKRDIKKIKEIQAVNLGRNKIFGFFIIFNKIEFDKTDLYFYDFEKFLQTEDDNNQLKIIYASGKVEFPRNTEEVLGV